MGIGGCLVVITMNRKGTDHIYSLLLSLLHGSHKTNSIVLIVHVSGVAEALLTLQKSACVSGADGLLDQVTYPTDPKHVPLGRTHSQG